MDNFECLDEKDVYNIILNKIHSQADDAYKKGLEERKTRDELKQFKRYNFIEKLGFKTKQYYTIVKFVKGEKLDNNMKRPLSEGNLKKLMSALKMKFVKTMYLVEY